ncbi:MAG: universal stress protein [Burkholderiales bacterium]|jgi:nucleotide-binding universal stress UspA family protein|nr:universal stress protein [Burkholderiales bacterium]
MPKFLLAVDGSEPSLAVTRWLVDSCRWYKDKPSVELLTVHPPVPLAGGMDAVVSRDMLDGYYREEGEKQLAGPKKILDDAGVSCTAHIFVGSVADTIVEQAKRLGCDMIYMGTHGRGAVGNLVVGSVATKVVHLASVPVVLAR